MTEVVTKAPGRRRLAAAGIVLAWCAVVAIAATAGWLVVDRAGISLLGATGPGLSGAVGGSAATSSAAASAAGSLATTGGRVTATCTPAGRISLQSVIPAQGWSYEVGSRGPVRLAVEFKRNARRVEVGGVCRAGVAVLTRDDGTSGQSGPTPAPTVRPPATVSSTDDHGGRSRGGSGSGGSGGSGKGGGSDDSGSGH